MTAVLPYAALNAVHTHPTGGPGLPADDGLTEPDKRFSVRVLLPWCDLGEGRGVCGEGRRRGTPGRG